MIYVICPPNLITGGPDALHQLVYYLNKNDIEAKIVYSRLKLKNYVIPTVYSCYVKDYLLLDEIVDSENNICIVPETLTFYLDKYIKIKKYIWWLSVDNNNISFKNKIRKVISKLKYFGKAILRKDILGRINEFIMNKKYDFTSEKLVTHLCASYYAYDYVSKRTNQECLLLIEPISLFFLSSNNISNINLNRKKRVLYNPAKNYEFSRKIIKKMKEINFIPLKGYNQKELISLFRENMVYMDFGFFPGAERLPKEAVINGCLIITGKNGASNFHGDVPILEKYKFDTLEDNIELICDKIRYMLENYDKLYSDFDEYRQTVLSLERNFNIQINDIFGT